MIHSRNLPFLTTLTIFVVAYLLCVMQYPAIFSTRVIGNLLTDNAFLGIAAVGMTFVILTGGIDLSVGAVMALIGTLSAGLMVNTGLSPAIALPAGLFIGLGIGIFNGALVAWGKMPAIIVTLATMGMARGLGLIYSGGYPVSGIPSWISWFGVGRIGVVPVPVVIMVVIYAIAWVLLQRTAFGRHVYALGGNELAARLSGVKTQRVKLAVYGISGVTAAFAALILTGRLMSGQPNAGVGFELDAIAAVVLGGTAIAGGRGLINPYLQDVIKGGIILLAIYIGREWR